MKKIKYLKLLFVAMITSSITLPAYQVNAYSSPHFATRINGGVTSSWNLSGYQGMQIVARGNTLYVSSYFDNIVYKVNADGSGGQVVAGISRQGGYSPDGSIAASSTLEGPNSIAVGNDGTVYIAEGYQHHVRAVLPSGILTTIAGNGTSVHPSQLTDAPDARQTPFDNPLYLKIGPDGNLYIYDSGVIRRVLPDGSTDHVAGAYGAAPNSNPYIEGGIAADHALFPQGGPDNAPFAFDPDGNLYAAANSSIYKINSSDNTIHTFANHTITRIDTLEDEPLPDTEFNSASGFDIDSQGQIWVNGGSQNTGLAIRYISPSDRVVRTAAGGGGTDLSPELHDYSSIVGSNLKMQSPTKTLSVSDSGKVYYIEPYTTSLGAFRYYIGVLSTSPVDTIPPTISASKSPAPNANGWNNTDVTVNYTCNDAQSGIASCSPPLTLSTDGVNQSATGTAVDNAGNSSSTTVSGINIDKTAPTATGGAINGWLVIHWANPTVTANVSDNLSGVVSGEYYIDTDPGQGNGKPMTYDAGTGKIKASPVISSGSQGYHTIYMRSKDAAGNWSTTTSVQYLYVL